MKLLYDSCCRAVWHTLFPTTKSSKKQAIKIKRYQHFLIKRETAKKLTPKQIGFHDVRLKTTLKLHFGRSFFITAKISSNWKESNIKNKIKIGQNWTKLKTRKKLKIGNGKKKKKWKNGKMEIQKNGKKMKVGNFPI